MICQNGPGSKTVSSTSHDNDNNNDNTDNNALLMVLLQYIFCQECNWRDPLCDQYRNYCKS